MKSKTGNNTKTKDEKSDSAETGSPPVLARPELLSTSYKNELYLLQVSKRQYRVIRAHMII